MAQYGKFAEIYDSLMHDDVDYDSWCDYIENLLHLNGCEPDTICELACGTGNITARLAERGYDVTGLDISSDMLRLAAKKLRGAHLIRSDMSRFRSARRYGAFLCMIDGINYLIDPAAVKRTFENVRRSLEENGVFIFDVSTRYKLSSILGNETYIHSEYDVFYSWQNRYIERYNISDMLLNFFIERGGGLYERFEERHLQRGYSIEQLKYMLRGAGFEKIEVYGELSYSAPKKNSERIVFACS